MGEVATLEPKVPPPPMMAGGRVLPVVPQSMEDAYRLARAVCVAGMAPKGLETPEKAMVAILHGMEVGLTPMAALQRIAVVNGRPTIWGDGAIGLVRGSGLVEWIKETIEGVGDKMVARCLAKRRGEPEPVPGMFSVEDAKKAGLWGKAGPWQQYPKRMLQMRARAFALRDGFADVLGGLYLREEIDDAPMRDVTPPAAQREAPAAPPATAIAPPVPSAEPDETPAPAADDLGDPDKFLDDLDAQLAGAADASDLSEVWATTAEPHIEGGRLFPPDAERARALYAKHKARIEA